jgi:hypothetical protein
MENGEDKKSKQIIDNDMKKYLYEKLVSTMCTYSKIPVVILGCPGSTRCSFIHAAIDIILIHDGAQNDKNNT